jgi:hypothetical protein
MVYVGVDLHRKRSHIVALDPAGEVVLSRRIGNAPTEFLRLFGELEPQPVEVAFEATYGWSWFADLLADAGIPAHMAHPLATKAISAARVKNDAVDARTLAHLLRTNLLAEAWIAPPDARQARRLVRTRAGMVRMRSRVQSQLHALLADLGIIPELTTLFGPAGRRWLAELQLPVAERSRLDAGLRLIDAITVEVTQANGELTGPTVTVVDRAHSRCEQLYTGDRVRFVRPYLDSDDLLPTYVPNGTAGHVLAVDPDRGQVVVRVDDGRTVTVHPAAHEDTQPLRLGYAGHALKLQGGQAPVVLVLPGGWQTSRQSAYSMATRCVDELHVFVDAQTQQTDSHRDPIQALGERWTRDAGKHAAAIHLDRTEELGRSVPDRRDTEDPLVVAPPESHERAAALPPQSLDLGRDLTDGLAIEL